MATYFQCLFKQAFACLCSVAKKCFAMFAVWFGSTWYGPLHQRIRALSHAAGPNSFLANLAAGLVYQYISEISKMYQSFLALQSSAKVRNVVLRDIEKGFINYATI